MRKSLLAVPLAVAALAAPRGAAAVVVVRHPVYVAPRPVVVVAPAPVVVAPAPVIVTPAPPPPAPPPSATTALPVNTTMWVLPSNCLKVAVSGQTYYQCGPNWMRPLPSEKGTYYAVVPPPQ
jgi:hypothetical protein